MHCAEYSPLHRRRLRAVFAGADWQQAVSTGAVAAAAAALRPPPPVTNVFALPVAQLRALNEARVRELIAAGERDEERLLAELGRWPDRWPADLPVRLSFLGANLGFACDMQPPCVYCNLRPVAERLATDDWRRLLRALPQEEGKGVYVYFTGGEPLLLGDRLWGPEGLIRAAGEAGAACNVNTNGLALTPAAALGLVAAGTGRLHLSLDTHLPAVADELYGRPGRWRQVVRGLHNLQLARSLLGVAHPVIHLNCVLTRRNADSFPDFLRFVLERKPLLAEGVSNELDFHLIPVGGEHNRELRLTAEAYERFFTQTWAQAEEVWQEYQAGRPVPADKRKTLAEQMPFLSPYHRVEQSGDLAAWAARAGAGLPGALALCRRCYVAPTQAFLLPDGSQYWCGGHAISRPEPVGNVLEAPVVANVRRGIAAVGALPADACRTCPGATQAINQTVEGRLREAVREWLGEARQSPEADEPPLG